MSENLTISTSDFNILPQNILFYTADKDLLKIEEGGKIFVHGEEVACSPKIGEALREFLIFQTGKDPLESPDYWAESVKIAEQLSYADKWVELEYGLGEYYIKHKTIESRAFKRIGPFTLPELHEKLISLRESER